MSVRTRLTLIAMLVVGAALVAVASVLVLLLSASLKQQACSTTRSHAVAAANRPVPTATAASDGEILQLVDADGNSQALPHGSPGQCRTVEPPGRFEDYTVVAEPVADRPDLMVVVARPLVDVLEATHFVTRVLAIGLPLVLLLAGGVTWYVVGRSLAPVAAIRAETERITADDLSRRVPVPPSDDEIARLATTVNRMLDGLQRAHDSQRRFVSDASHELRSPIAVIRQHAEVALLHPERTSVADLATTVHAENLRLQALVEDLLLLARADEQLLDLRTTIVDLDDLVFEEAARLRTCTDLRIDTTAVSAGRVRGNDGGLRRVLRNLGDNAARHADTTITFSLSQQNGSVILTVADDGPGIPQPDRERVFDRFVRLNQARSRDEGGAGLGLAIVAQLVAVHHGSVHADANPFGGATIRIDLPAT